MKVEVEVEVDGEIFLCGTILDDDDDDVLGGVKPATSAIVLLCKATIANMAPALMAKLCLEMSMVLEMCHQMLVSQNYK
jgi:hypothetical protein